MAQELEGRDLDLYQSIDEVLHYMWDPIGVSGVPETRDEYSSYLPIVYEMVKSGKTEDEIVQYLYKVVTENMGLRGSLEEDRKVAKIILTWADRLSKQDKKDLGKKPL